MGYYNEINFQTIIQKDGKNENILVIQIPYEGIHRLGLQELMTVKVRLKKDFPDNYGGY